MPRRSYSRVTKIPTGGEGESKGTVRRRREGEFRCTLRAINAIYPAAPAVGSENGARGSGAGVSQANGDGNARSNTKNGDEEANGTGTNCDREAG